LTNWKGNYRWHGPDSKKRQAGNAELLEGHQPRAVAVQHRAGGNHLGLDQRAYVSRRWKNRQCRPVQSIIGAMLKLGINILFSFVFLADHAPNGARST
jgi:hypothetical protein